MSHNRGGSALLLVIFVLSAFSVLGAICTKIVYNYYASANAVLVREQAFCLAEAGLEKGKVELAHNPAWYTDLPSYRNDDAAWLLNHALGQETQFGEGSIKVIREKGRNYLYSIGSKGSGLVILKCGFSLSPFKSGEWEEL